MHFMLSIFPEKFPVGRSRRTSWMARGVSVNVRSKTFTGNCPWRGRRSDDDDETLALTCHLESSAPHYVRPTGATVQRASSTNGA